MINGNRTKSERKRSPRDFYQTPLALATAAMIELDKDERILDQLKPRFLDAGCGTGVWGRGMSDAWLLSNWASTPTLIGVDIQPNIDPACLVYDKEITTDFLAYDDEYGFDLVFGNPPYSLAEEFVRHAYYLIGQDDYVFFLLRLSFLEGIKRCRGLYKDIPLKRVYVCSRRPSFFSSDGKRNTTDTLAYGMFLWQKGYRGQPTISFLDWDYS
jgi:hypothetical protein